MNGSSIPQFHILIGRSVYILKPFLGIFLLHSVAMISPVLSVFILSFNEEFNPFQIRSFATLLSRVQPSTENNNLIFDACMAEINLLQDPGFSPHNNKKTAVNL